MFRRKPHPPPTSADPSTATGTAPTTATQTGHSPDPYVTRLEAMLTGQANATREPILTENEALVVLELLERLIDQTVDDRVVDLARTVIVRILDRVDHPPAGANNGGQL